jgi:hypothetical protein
MHQELATFVPGSTARAGAVLEDRRNPLSVLRSRLFGSRSTDAVGPKGEQKVGKELAKLPAGWRVLHRLQVTEAGTDIDHIVIGPPGIVTVHTKHHPKAKVKVYDRSMYVDGQTHQHYVWSSERESKRAATTLSGVCGFHAPSQSAIVFVDVSEVQHKGRPYGVTVITRPQLVDWLTALPAHLQPRQVEHLFVEARRPEVWLPA